MRTYSFFIPFGFTYHLRSFELGQNNLVWLRCLDDIESNNKLSKQRIYLSYDTYHISLFYWCYKCDAIEVGSLTISFTNYVLMPCNSPIFHIHYPSSSIIIFKKNQKENMEILGAQLGYSIRILCTMCDRGVFFKLLFISMHELKVPCNYLIL